jgi:hypothetical protein
MEKDTILKLNKRFEEYAYEQDGIEYWLARELQELLGYADWRNFLNAINKAKESCETTGEGVSDHFVDVNKMVKIGSGAERKQEDFMLTRYACYLIAQNGDPKKEQIAFAQSYFAIQTRRKSAFSSWSVYRRVRNWQLLKPNFLKPYMKEALITLDLQESEVRAIGLCLAAIIPAI